MKTKKELSSVTGTIANHLTAHKDELWACGSNIKQMRIVALRLLDDPCLKDKEAVMKAKKIFSTTRDNLFMSCLCTYMLGERIDG